MLHEGEWLDVQADPSRLVVNAGDLIPVWTNGAFHSALHRVVATEETRAHQRLSIVFFTGPSDDTLVTPIVRDGEQRRFQPVTAGEHLRAKLEASQRE